MGDTCSNDDECITKKRNKGMNYDNVFFKTQT